MLLHLSGEMTYEIVGELIKSLNSLPLEEPLEIYFTTTGGLVDVAEAFIHIINNNKGRITINFYGEIFSCGMVIFLKTECKKNILPDAKGMYHFTWQDMTISEGGKPTDSFGIFSLKEMKQSKNRTMTYLATTKLNPQEIKAIKQGKDVYFSSSRLEELI